ncbi:glucokinase [Marichromatium bheemlicum]|uniref:Glucokinase n=1 Tax=Marichromatium bheemlicum TaxID=365339 RepID=A0ABX1IA32_9GAMM|nr:glucokinase [Marichromatium bheemlicum]NKN33701.1 glucokinase [Marichromatium bheemlicum]
MRVLVGDIGGTKTALASVELTAEGALRLHAPQRYPSADYPGLGPIVQAYLGMHATPCVGAAFAIAGPVAGRCSQATNLAWRIDADVLERELGLAPVTLLNDLEAVAWGIDALAPEDVCELQPGEPGGLGNRCVIAAGTGLGEAGLCWDGRRHHPFATEGGHAGFAPSDGCEWALLQFLQRRYRRVSWERLVSGMGIGAIHAFCCERAGEPLPQPSPTPAEIAAGAQRGDACCAEAMALFFRLYGREAGDLALKQMALGGVYLGGGIAPRNLEALRASAFLDAFLDKGRMRGLMQRMPVRVILQPQVALLGAARAWLVGRAPD